MEFLTLLFKNAEMAIIAYVFIWLIIIVGAIKLISIILEMRKENAKIIELNEKILKELQSQNNSNKDK